MIMFRFRPSAKNEGRQRRCRIFSMLPVVHVRCAAPATGRERSDRSGWNVSISILRQADLHISSNYFKSPRSHSPGTNPSN